MKLSKLYTNKPNVFEPIDFVHGLNVVVAEIRLHENLDKDTHNLGKTTLGRVLDYCFLAGTSKDHFLIKHGNLFSELVFYLEIELEDGTYATIRRAIAESSKISFKSHEASHQDFVSLPISSWDHQDVSFQKARVILDGILDWRALKPWSYRKSLGYLLRSQEDYREVFKLRKFASKHADWKPFLAHLLGFDAALIDQHYKNEQILAEKEEIVNTIKKELGGSIEDISKVEGILLLKQKDAEKKQTILDDFDFRVPDKENLKQLVDNVDRDLSDANQERYSLNQNRRKIVASLEDDQILFDPEEAERLFREAGVLFSGQIKKDFEQLIGFNKAITDERRGYLQEELVDLKGELKRVNAKANRLGKKRSDMLSFLSDTNVVSKYKIFSDELVVLKADISSLERQREHLHRLQELRTEIRKLKEALGHLQIQIEENVESQNSDKDSLFSTIRVYFNEIVEEVVDRKALLSVSPNSKGHLEYKAELLDQSGNSTSADHGYSYRKLLCIAFDVAILIAHIDVKFPFFVFHDGVFESLDDRKKENLLQVIRKYADLGLQPIITMIDSDMPPVDAKSQLFSDDEIILTLHDEGAKGRLFKLNSW